MWTRLVEQTTERLPPGLDVSMDEASRAAKPGKQLESDATTTDAIPIGIQALDVGYTSLKQHLQKSQGLFGVDHTDLQCCICHTNVPSSGASTLVCSYDGCPAVSHLQCLANTFHAEAGLEGESDLVVRSSGHCPTCASELHWVDLVKELTLRMRGEKEIKAVFKPKRTKKGAATEVVEEDLESSGEEDDLPDMIPEDEWHQIGDSSDDENASVKKNMTKSHQSDPVPGRRPLKALAQSRTPYSEPVIEDSEWDEAELLT